jgi:hypothetical protein
MRRIASETQLYVQLAHRGDPAAFYALFYGQINELYLLLRSQGKDHETACGEATPRLAEAYRRFVRSRPGGRPDRWFAARCGLKRFDAAAAGGTGVSKTDAAAYERAAFGAINRAYCVWLDRYGDSSGDIVEGRSFVRYLVGTAAAVILIGFLFFSQSVLSVGFGRYGAEYKLSFPKIAAELWDMSGLVRTTDDDAWSRGGGEPPAPQGAEAATRP